MTASERCKQVVGVPLSKVARMLELHPDTLGNWYRDNRERFEIVLLGCEIKLLIERRGDVEK